MIFDNDKATALLHKYRDTEDQYILGEFLEECRGLISVIASNYATSEEHKDDLMQEARWQILKVLKDYDFSMNKKLYSWLSIVIRNAIIDSIRKERPTQELNEFMSDDREEDDSEYIVDVAGEMLNWFISRFPSIVKEETAYELLESILADIMDQACGKRKLINNLKEHYGLSQADAKILCDAVIVKLRMLLGENVQNLLKPNEKSLEPELQEIVGKDSYYHTKLIFKGLSLKFNNSVK